MYPHLISNKIYHLKQHYFGLKLNVEQGAIFCCVSETTKKDLLNFYPGLKERVHVIHNSIPEFFYVENYNLELAKKIINSKSLGEILNIRGLYGKSKILTYDKSDWRSKKKFAGGGILLDQGIHLLDLINYFCGPFVTIKSFVTNKYWNYDVEDDVFSIFKNKKNVVASIHSTAVEWQHKFRMEISLQKGSLELNGILSGSKSYGRESIVISNVFKTKYSTKIKKKIVYFKKDISWKKEIDEFANVLLRKAKIINGTSKEALEVMKMVYKIYKNDKRGS